MIQKNICTLKKCHLLLFTMYQFCVTLCPLSTLFYYTYKKNLSIIPNFIKTISKTSLHFQTIIQHQVALTTSKSTLKLATVSHQFHSFTTRDQHCWMLRLLSPHKHPNTPSPPSKNNRYIHNSTQRVLTYVTSNTNHWLKSKIELNLYWSFRIWGVCFILVTPTTPKNDA